MNEQKEVSLVSLSSILILLLTGMEQECTSNGAVVVSPSPRAEVCHVGERLKVMCSVINSTATILQWNLNFTSETGVANHLSSTVSTTRTSVQRELLDSIVFSFRRSSQLGVLPLASILDITQVKNSLNGARISCTEQINSNSATEAGSTTVFIVGENPGYYHPRTPNVEYDKYFGTDTITVSLRWTNDSELENPLVGYHVYVTPNNDIDNTIISVTSTCANVTLSYNTPYIVSVMANFCGQSNATANIELNYAKCAKPLDEESDSMINIVFEQSNPWLEGSSINFTCTYGFILNGPNTAICMSNGSWSLDIRNVRCILDPIMEIIVTEECKNNSTSEQCSSDEKKDTTKVVIAGVSGSLIGIILFITIILVATTIIIVIIKRKDILKKVKGKGAERSVHNLSTPNNNQMLQSSTQLVYADIGPSSFKNKKRLAVPILLELDDSHVEYSQIKHNVGNQQSRFIEKKEPDGDLTTINLDNLLIQLRPQVCLKWYQFGEAAGISNEVLDSYARSCMPEDCIMEMLDYWLRNHIGKPTWREVTNLVRAIGLQKLACDIEMVYSTGHLPIEVDMNSVPNDQECDSNPVEDDTMSLAENPPPLPPKEFINNNTPPLPPKMKREFIDNDTMMTFVSDKKQIYHKKTYSEVSPQVPARPPKP